MQEPAKRFIEYMDKLPSAHQHGDFVNVSFADAGFIKNCQIDGILFDIGKVRYNLTVKMTIDGETYFTNLLDIDSAFIQKVDGIYEGNQPPKSEMRKK